MTTYSHLRKLFADIAVGALAVQSAACSDPAEIRRNGFAETSCDAQQQLSAVAFADAVDYLAIRRIVTNSQFEPIPDSPAQTQSEVGVPCSGAAVPDACDASFDALPLGPGFPDPTIWGPTGIFQLVWTRGDDTGVITNAEELQRFLGTIDTPEEAALIVRFATGQSMVCDGPNARVVDGGFEVIATEGTACGANTERVESVLRIGTDGSATVLRSVVVEVGDPGCAIGRLTSGLSAPAARRHAGLGSYFADMARLEATAVIAFERLAAELDVLGAPRSLVQRARSAAQDERRHVELVAALAERFGGSPPSPDVHGDMSDEEAKALPLRGAFEIALENATEGCVRETYGALVGTFQATRAGDAGIRRALAAIADDETRHAAFSWDLAKWAEGVLTSAEVRRVRRRRAQAVRLFRTPYDTGLPAADRARAGLPTRAEAQALFAGLHHSVLTSAPT